LAYSTPLVSLGISRPVIFFVSPLTLLTITSIASFVVKIVEIGVSQFIDDPSVFLSLIPLIQGITKEYPPALLSVHENVTNCPEFIDETDDLYEVTLGVV